MPWVNEEMCTGCEVCIENCPAGSISMGDKGTANIDMDECIRCGTCHSVCPQEAIRHDSEKIPEKVRNNVETARRLLKKCVTKEARISYLDKYLRAFKLQMKVADKSYEKIEELKNEILSEK